MSKNLIIDRLKAVRKEMKKKSLDVLVVRSADRYLNEYVPPDDSGRLWVSGFTGSMGDVVITPRKAFVVVDGRYWTQADKEMKGTGYDVERVPFGTSISAQVVDLVLRLAKSSRKSKFVVGYESEKNTLLEQEQLTKELSEKAELLGLAPSPVDLARASEESMRERYEIRCPAEKLFGTTVKDKLNLIAPKLQEKQFDAVLVQKLDTIAYLSNLRAFEMPFQATFRSMALVTPKTLYVSLHTCEASVQLRASRPGLSFVSEEEFWALIGSHKNQNQRIGLVAHANTVWAKEKILSAGGEAVVSEDLIAPIKAKKNRTELKAMERAFAKADEVVRKSIQWLCKTVVENKKVTEADFARKVEEEFSASGALGLSFRVISAVGKNGALIHYSPKNSKRVIRRGELMLLDTGAYYEEAYATDLTRTFLVDSPKATASEEQKFYFTMVLKSAIAGMTAILPENFRGYQLDAITRAPLWDAGLDFRHGTGHGVGINVHEFPPRVGPNAATSVEVGHVFSIEPGVYLPRFGGVRIENICTVEPVPKRKGYVRVKPMTFSPLDRRLIAKELLTKEEKAFLSAFSSIHGSTTQRKLRAKP